jgi:hypothetical protein
MDQTKLVILKTFASRPEVDVAKSALASAGIDSFVEADTAGHMREHLAWSGPGFHLLVHQDDVQDALDFLSAPTVPSSDSEPQ